MTSRLQIQSQPPACHDDALADLREILRVTRPDADVERIQRAYDVAASWHPGQTRRSGDPYITHPLAVATILAETGADDEMLCAALLHDTIEDTPYTLAALSGEFGAGVAALVTGTAALDQVKGRGRRTVSQVMAVAKCADTRVLTIKLADRAVHPAGQAAAQGQGIARYLRAGRSSARHGYHRGGAGSARLCHDETQPARAFGLRPPAPRGGRAAPRGHPHPVVRGMARRTAHAARPATGFATQHSGSCRCAGSAAMGQAGCRLVSASNRGPTPCSSASARTRWSLDRLTVRAWLG